MNFNPAAFFNILIKRGVTMERITNSSISQFKRCRKEYYYRYMKELVPRREGMARGIGSAVHKGLETGSIDDALELFDRIFPADQTEADALEYNRVTVRAMLEGYFEKYGKDWEGEFRPEVQFNIPVINPATGKPSRSFTLAGKADGLLHGRTDYWLVEYKTSGTTVDKRYVDKLLLDSQMTTYIYGIQRQEGIKISGVIYRVLRKPSIRQTKKETFIQFTDRLIEDYRNRPEFYFYEEQVYRTQADLKEFELELWDYTQDLLKCRRDQRWYKNTSQCGAYAGCDYMPLCLHEQDAELRYESRAKNIELKEEELHVTAS